MMLRKPSGSLSTPDQVVRVGSIREANTELVLKAMRSGLPFTRAELAAITSLTPQALGPILSKLVSSGLVDDHEARAHGPGRPPVTYTINPEGSISGTFLLGFADLFVVTVNSLGERLALVHLRHGPAATPKEILDRAFTHLHAMLVGGGIAMDRLASVEVVLEGRVNENALVVHETPSWKERDVDLGAALLEYLPVDTRISIRSTERTSALRALEQVSPLPNELVAILHIGHHNHLFLALGNRLMASRNGRHGDLTHVAVGGLDQPCECGRSGCLGLVASGSALITTYAELTGEKLPAAVDVMARISEGDTHAVESARRWSKWLAIGLGPILMMLDPDRVVVTGAVGLPSSHGAGHFTEMLQSELRNDSAKVQFDVVPRPESDINLSALRSALRI